MTRSAGFDRFLALRALRDPLRALRYQPLKTRIPPERREIRIDAQPGPGKKVRLLQQLLE